MSEYDGPSYMDHVFASPPVEEVGSEYPLPDLGHANSLQPVPAFSLFMEYTEHAISTMYIQSLRMAHEKVEYMANRVQVREGGPFSFAEFSKEQREAIDAEVLRELRERCQPLIGAVTAYARQRGNDPVTFGRITWMMDQIALVRGNWPGAKLDIRMQPPDGQRVTANPCERVIRRELLDGLQVILGVATTPSNGTTATQGTTAQPIIWKGNPAELFALFEELVGKGWIELPKNRGKRSRAELARTVHAAFAFASGTILTEGTALNYLKKGRDGINEQRPEPRVVFTLKRNPDVGTDYDPDKAGE